MSRVFSCWVAMEGNAFLGYVQVIRVQGCIPGMTKYIILWMMGVVWVLI